MMVSRTSSPKSAAPAFSSLMSLRKSFKKDYNDTGILSIMDGVFNSPYRRVFLLTINNLYVK